MNKNLTPPQMLGLAVLLFFLGFLPLGSEITSNIFYLAGLILIVCAIVGLVSDRLKKK